MNNRKLLIIGIVFICLVVPAVVYADSKSNVFSKYFNNGDEYIKEGLIADDDQAFEYDGYVISLVSHSYNADAMDGFCLFNISQIDGKTDKLGEYNENSAGLSVCDGHFSFEILASGSIATIPENYENSLNVYFYFTITEIVEEEKNLVYLYDNFDGSDLPVHAFYISDTGNSKVVETGEVEIVVSELGVAINTSENFEIYSLIVFQNGKKYVMLEDGMPVDNCYLTEGKAGEGYSYKCKTDILLDIDAVTAVEINGQTYSLD